MVSRMYSSAPGFFHLTLLSHLFHLLIQESGNKSPTQVKNLPKYPL